MPVSGQPLSEGQSWKPGAGTRWPSKNWKPGTHLPDGFNSWLRYLSTAPDRKAALALLILALRRYNNKQLFIKLLLLLLAN